MFEIQINGNSHGHSHSQKPDLDNKTVFETKTMSTSPQELAASDSSINLVRFKFQFNYTVEPVYNEQGGAAESASYNRDEL